MTAPLLSALRSAFGSRSFTASEVGVAAHMGHEGLRAAFYAAGMRSFNATHIGKKFVPLLRDGRLRLEPWKGSYRYRVPAESTAQIDAGDAQTATGSRRDSLTFAAVRCARSMRFGSGV